MLIKLIVLCFTPFSTLFPLNFGGQYTYFILFSSSIYQHSDNILFKPRATFQHNHCWRMDSSERGMNPVVMTLIIPRREYFRGSNHRSHFLKSCPLPTDYTGWPSLYKFSTCSVRHFLNSLPNDRTLNLLKRQTLILSKFKAFADDNLNVSDIANFIFEKALRKKKEKETDYQAAFSPFPTMFANDLSTTVAQSRFCAVKGYTSQFNKYFFLYCVTCKEPKSTHMVSHVLEIRPKYLQYCPDCLVNAADVDPRSVCTFCAF